MKTGVLFGRLMKHILRSPDTIITVAITPIGIMLMFVYVFGGAIKSSLPEGVNYVSCQLAGILLMAIASGIGANCVRPYTDSRSTYQNQISFCLVDVYQYICLTARKRKAKKRQKRYTPSLPLRTV